MAFAFIGTAIRMGPHPYLIFDGLRNWIVFAWLLAFVPFAIGIFLDWRSLAHIEIERSNWRWRKGGK